MSMKKHADDMVEALVDGLKNSGDGITTKVKHMRVHADDAVSKMKKLDDDLAGKQDGTPGGKKDLIPQPDPKVLETVRNTPNGQRPDPRTYLSPEYIEAHLQPFRDSGAIRFTSQSSVDKYHSLGPAGGTFVLPRSEFESVVERTGGDLRQVEKALGLAEGRLADGDTLIAYIKPENLHGLRMPDGNESGANEFWEPGGLTSGGVPEATIDVPENLPYISVTIGK